MPKSRRIKRPPRPMTALDWLVYEELFGPVETRKALAAYGRYALRTTLAVRLRIAAAIAVTILSALVGLGGAYGFILLVIKLGDVVGIR